MSTVATAADQVGYVISPPDPADTRLLEDALAFMRPATAGSAQVHGDDLE